MGKEEKAPEESQLIRIEETSLEETQLAEQLYNSAGLGPVVDAGLKDYDEHLHREDKLISKVLGPRGGDIKGYGDAVAKRVAFAVYALLNKQYGGKVGDLRSYIMTLQEERDRANAKYDELLGRVVGILGDEYKELRTDSKAFMEKLTTIVGEDLKESRIDHKALAESLADIDGLRSQVRALDNDKEQLKERYESQITVLENEHNEEVGNLRSQIAEMDSRMKALESERTGLTNDLAQLRRDYDQLAAERLADIDRLRSQIAEMDSRIEGLESEKTGLTNDLAQLRRDYDQLAAAIATLAEVIPHEEIGKDLGEELYASLLRDSKVPNMVIRGAGKFIDFRKYLEFAAIKGAEEATKQARETLRNTFRE